MTNKYSLIREDYLKKVSITELSKKHNVCKKYITKFLKEEKIAYHTNQYKAKLIKDNYKEECTLNELYNVIKTKTIYPPSRGMIRKVLDSNNLKTVDYHKNHINLEQIVLNEIKNGLCIIDIERKHNICWKRINKCIIDNKIDYDKSIGRGRGRGDGFTRNGFIQSCNGSAKLYQLKCFKDEEVFYKIGITGRSISTRFCKANMPYDFMVLDEIEGSPGFVWDLEKEIKDKFKRYSPKMTFPGHTECYYEDINLKSTNEDKEKNNTETQESYSKEAY